MKFDKAALTKAAPWVLGGGGLLVVAFFLLRQRGGQEGAVAPVGFGAGLYPFAFGGLGAGQPAGSFSPAAAGITTSSGGAPVAPAPPSDEPWCGAACGIVPPEGSQLPPVNLGPIIESQGSATLEPQPRPEPEPIGGKWGGGFVAPPNYPQPAPLDKLYQNSGFYPYQN